MKNFISTTVSTFYKADHPIYPHLLALKKLKTDITGFFREAIPKFED